MNKFFNTLFFAGLVITAASSAHAALSGCTNPDATLVRDAYVHSYPKEFCSTGLTFSLPNLPRARYCITALYSNVELAADYLYDMCLLPEGNGYRVLAARDARGE